LSLSSPHDCGLPVPPLSNQTPKPFLGYE
jgi:hypothetical protein